MQDWEVINKIIYCRVHVVANPKRLVKRTFHALSFFTEQL